MTVEVASPELFQQALAGLSERDQIRIREAIVEADPDLQGASVTQMQFTVRSGVQLLPRQTLIADIMCQRNVMVQVATQKLRINDVDDYYRARRKRIQTTLQALGIDDPNPHEDLWSWYKKWSAEFSRYQERRDYIGQIYKPLLEQLCTQRPEPAPAREPTGWERVDRAVAKARAQLEVARDEEDHQAIGLLCREIIISLGRAVYDAERHHAPDGVTPSTTDGRRMIEAYVASEFGGPANKEIRAHAKASLNLAVALQHKRTASFRFAALCLESTSSLVNQLAILTGRRDPT